MRILVSNPRRYAPVRRLGLLLLFAVAAQAQPPETHLSSNYVLLRKGESLDDIIRDAAHVVPSPRQWSWQQLEFTGFLHFGMNTFANLEWGTGKASPALFNPTGLDARQWVRVAKEAGIRELILTAKHHDGFCLWPSKYSEYSVRNSPWRHGKGDVVKDIAEACKEAGLKFGVYLSPWDRHDPSYGDSPKYNRHFLDQLGELLTDYGPISEVWFDGANGEGPNGKRQVYDWHAYYALIRKLQPNAVIAIMGPDVRWVGTESGYGRKTEWSVLPASTLNVDSVAAHSQQTASDAAFVPRDLMAEDLGSREQLAHARALAWYPSETDVSIRPGWFYHASENDRVKTPKELVDIYYSSVGRNSVLLLNIPPDTRGRINDADVASLRGMRTILDQTFAVNLLTGCRPRATSHRPGHDAAGVVDGDPDTYWTTDQGVDSAVIRFDLQAPATFDRALLQEYIRVGQRIERFRLDAWNGTAWDTVASGTTVGYMRLLRFPPVTASSVRLVIEQSRSSPTLAAVGLFASPPVVRADPDGGAFKDSIRVVLSTNGGTAPIHFTLDGSPPTLRSPRYAAPLVLFHSTLLRAVPEIQGAAGGEETVARFTRCLPVQAISVEQSWSPKYACNGAETLIDGRQGNPEDLQAGWLGFEGVNVTATLDLGQIAAVHRVNVGFLQHQSSWVFLPVQVQVSLSRDGHAWVDLPARNIPVAQSEVVGRRAVDTDVASQDARFVKIRAISPGKCPPWHPGAGGKAWMFLDEIVVQ